MSIPFIILESTDIDYFIIGPIVNVRSFECDEFNMNRDRAKSSSVAVNGTGHQPFDRHEGGEKRGCVRASIHHAASHNVENGTISREKISKINIGCNLNFNYSHWLVNVEH